MNDNSPLSTVIVRALFDKGYDKRKNAALEIEKIVKEFAQKSDTEQIRNVISVLSKFVLTPSPHSRKGGIIGLASVAMGLGTRVIDIYITDLVTPIFPCFKDNTPHVRYYATESLYNICRVARGGILPLFLDIFTVITDLSMETDANVKSAAELLDKVMKDIVTESSAFDLVTFVPVLSEKLLIDHISTQMVMISWVSVLQSIPDINLVPFLPNFIDGLFFILKSPKAEIKNLTEGVIGELMYSIRRKPENVKYTHMINILIIHAQSEDVLVQKVALTMIVAFVHLSFKDMLPFASGILCASLSCISTDDVSLTATKSLAEEVSNCLMELIKNEDDVYVEVDEGAHSLPMEKINSDGVDSSSDKLDLYEVMKVLKTELTKSSVPCKTTVLRWLFHLNDNVSIKMNPYVDDMFTMLLNTINDQSDAVILLALQVLAQIASSNFPAKDVSRKEVVNEHAEIGGSRELLAAGTYFERFLSSILNLFESDYQLLKKRGAFIVRQLSVMLPSEDIFRTFANLLLEAKNLTFANIMVETLSSILLTSKELYSLRCRLRDLSSEENCDLFVCLYRCWCHSHVATLTLCLLSRSYVHAANLVHVLGELDLTTDTLVELDKLVQMIESPIFAFLRMHLLCPMENKALVETLYGILMLLPQTEAFQMLRCRLNCVPPAHLTGNRRNAPLEPAKKIDYSFLLKHFLETQEKHKQFREEEIRNRVESSMKITATS